jgi:hypothetical protein
LTKTGAIDGLFVRFGEASPARGFLAMSGQIGDAPMRGSQRRRHGRACVMHQKGFKELFANASHTLGGKYHRERRK